MRKEENDLSGTRSKKSELAPAKEFAYELWRGSNGCLSVSDISGSLEGAGFKVSAKTLYTWLSKWQITPETDTNQRRTPKLAGRIATRALELYDARRAVYNMVYRNSDIAVSAVVSNLAGQGFPKIARTTVYCWVKRAKEGKTPRFFGRKRGVLIPWEDTMVKPPIPEPDLTWKDIIEKVPNRDELAQLLLDGVVSHIGELHTENAECRARATKMEAVNVELRKNIDFLVKDRNEVLQKYNELLSETRDKGKWTLDQTRHQLIPKVR